MIKILNSLFFLLFMTNTLLANDGEKDKNPGSPFAAHLPLAKEVDTKNTVAPQEATKKPHILVEQDGLITRMHNRDDFIFQICFPINESEFKEGGVFYVPQDGSFKNLIATHLKTWEDGDNKPIANIFRLLDQSDALSPQAVISWIDDNVQVLPSAFLYMKAVRLAELKDKTWTDWYRFAVLRMGMDAKKCKDPSATAAVSQIIQYFHKQVSLFVGGVEGCKDLLSPEAQMNSLRNALQLHRTVLSSNRFPYWVAFHGMDAFESVPDDNSFFPKARWAQIEEDCMKELFAKNPALKGDQSAAAAGK